MSEIKKRDFPDPGFRSCCVRSALPVSEVLGLFYFSRNRFEERFFPSLQAAPIPIPTVAGIGGHITYYEAPRSNLSMMLFTHRAQGVLVTKMELWIPQLSPYVSNVTARLRGITQIRLDRSQVLWRSRISLAGLVFLGV